jgi:hypothetical protein
MAEQRSNFRAWFAWRQPAMQIAQKMRSALFLSAGVWCEFWILLEQALSRRLLSGGMRR